MTAFSLQSLAAGTPAGKQLVEPRQLSGAELKRLRFPLAAAVVAGVALAGLSWLVSPRTQPKLIAANAPVATKIATAETAPVKLEANGMFAPMPQEYRRYRAPHQPVPEPTNISAVPDTKYAKN